MLCSFHLSCSPDVELISNIVSPLSFAVGTYAIGQPFAMDVSVIVGGANVARKRKLDDGEFPPELSHVHGKR